MKRYRKSIEPRQIRFYALGEYGPTTFRPHYHAIIFSASWDDFPNIRKLWGHGNIKFEPINPSRIHYITKYHVNANPSLSKELKIEPEFTLMSRRPGIGAKYLETAKHGHHNRYIEINGYKMRMPRFFAQKLYSEADIAIMATMSKAKAIKKRLNEENRLARQTGRNGTIELQRREIEASKKITNKNPHDNHYL